ncbi:MBL fold metallo-hydrolase [Membranihabitans marinus]
MIQENGVNLVVDIGPDFRTQMLASFPGKLQGILLTHEHNDHTAGLDDVRPFNFLFRKDVTLYGMNRVLKDLKHRFAYVFSRNQYPGIPRLKLRKIEPWDDFKIKGVKILPLPVHHGNLEILGFRIDDFCYLTDVKTIDESVIHELRGIEVLVLSALHRKPHHSHLNLKEAVALIEQIQPRNAYLTHLSHNMGLHREVEFELPQNVKLAYDGLILEI